MATSTPSRLQDEELGVVSPYRAQRRQRRWCDEDDTPAGIEEEIGYPLPPLPTPDLMAMRSEATSGCSVVICLICTFCGVTIGFASSNEKHGTILIAAVLLEAVVALICLAYLMWGDPGVVKRTRQSCQPLPEGIAERLAAFAIRDARDTSHPLDGMRNIKDPNEPPRSYCVRCCLWREEKEPRARGLAAFCCPTLNAEPHKRIAMHHCSTCQRCVRHFDHHCGVFGRCIAGTWRTGNMPFFCTIIAMGYAGGLTTIVAAVMGMTSLVNAR